MKALILAAGQGTRLRQLTRERPKPMLPVRGKPLLAHTIEWLCSHGITDIAINLHHNPHVVSRYFGNGKEYGASIHYSYEEKLLGTAGAAKRLETFLDEPFVVVYGDVLTNVNLRRLAGLHIQGLGSGHTKSVLTMALFEAPNPTACGLVGINSTGRVSRFVEKPPAEQVFTDLAAAGIMIVDPAIFEYIPEDTEYDFGHDLIPVLMTAPIAMYALPIQSDEYVIDIGTLQGYLRAMQMSPGSKQIPAEVTAPSP